MTVWHCPKCGADLKESASVCPSCGAPADSGGKALDRDEGGRRRGKQVKWSLVLLGCVLVGAFAFLARRTGPGGPQVLSLAEIHAIRARAEKGDPQAQTALAAAYAKGEGIKQDYAAAASWYKQAAEKGNAAAQGALGELYEAGQGVPHDLKEAARWYRQAAEQGLGSAQYELAALYAVGTGVPLDNTEALKWYLRAAEQGQALAQYSAGMRYSEGRGVAQDLVLGYKWLSLAANQGLPEAANGLKRIEGRMSSEQLARGRELVKAFRPRGTGSAPP